MSVDWKPKIILGWFLDTEQKDAFLDLWFANCRRPDMDGEWGFGRCAAAGAELVFQNDGVTFLGRPLADCDAEKFEKNLADAMAELKTKYANYLHVLPELEVRAIIFFRKN